MRRKRRWEIVSKFFHLGLAGEEAEGEDAHEHAEAEHDADGLIGMFAHNLVGASHSRESALLDAASAGLDEVLAVLDDGFEVLDELLQLEVLSVSGFGSHEAEDCGKKGKGKWGVCPLREGSIF